MNPLKQSPLIVAGGTGGHVFPALSLALNLMAQGHWVTFVTDRRGFAYVASYQDQMTIRVLPLDRKGSGVMGALRLMMQVVQSFFVSLPLVIRATSVIGFSGFPTFATLLAAVCCFKTIDIHEQNAVLGKVNRWLAPFVRRIYVSTKRLQKIPHWAHRKIEFVGMPVRSDIAALNEEPYPIPGAEGAFNLLITGGSQGAQSFATVIPKAIALLPAALQRSLTILHQVRLEDQEAAKSIYDTLPLAGVTLVPFIEDMAAALRHSHLVISRAGASTLAEITAAGRPCILIPYPHATDDHQFYNAQEVVKAGGGWSITHQDFTPEAIMGLLLDLMQHPKKLLVASQLVKIGYEKNSINTLAQRALVV